MRIPEFMCVLLAATTAGTGCDRRDEHVIRYDGFLTHEPPDDPTVRAMDSITVVPAPAPGAQPVEVRPEESGGRASDVPDATAFELAELGATLVVPVAGVARSQLRDNYTEARGDRVHEALDILAARGTPVLSAADGTLLKLFNSRPGGLMVYAMDSSERYILLYGHLDGYADGLTEGMPLARGQVIGYVGTTGNAQEDTPHLHFGILRGQPRISWWEGTPVNPYPLLSGGAR